MAPRCRRPQPCWRHRTRPNRHHRSSSRSPPPASTAARPHHSAGKANCHRCLRRASARVTQTGQLHPMCWPSNKRPRIRFCSNCCAHSMPREQTQTELCTRASGTHRTTRSQSSTATPNTTSSQRCRCSKAWVTNCSSASSELQFTSSCPPFNCPPPQAVLPAIRTQTRPA